MIQKRPELMAPAGSMAALRAALAAGADAVYLGGKQFNARQSAQNFEADELRQAVRLAHRAHAKVYVTVNTLQKSDELPAAAQFLREIYNLGADAAIVQDPGLIALARETTPQLELHASTQLTIHNVAGVAAMEQLGVSRVVLARELSEQEIRRIRQESKLGLEVFLHGALCIAYSGQCLLSSLTGGRSGNRGQCAQICRLPYQLQEGRSGHLQSPRDLCLYPQLPYLLALGLDALKIEGRLKRPAYVATVVRVYREAIDRWAVGLPIPGWSEVEQGLLQAFNRGFSSGYFLGKPAASLLTADKPSHLGVTVGRVLPDGRIDLEQELTAGDVLEAGDGSELRVQRSGRPTSLPGLGLAPGYAVRRLQSAEQEQWAADLVASFAPDPLQVSWRACLLPDVPLQVTASAAGKTVTVSGDKRSEVAINRSVDADLLLRQLSKTGDSGFSSGPLEAEIGANLSLPVSEINSCRRRALDELAELLWGRPQQLDASVVLPKPPYCPGSRGQTKLAVAVADQACLMATLPFAPDRVYFGTARHGFSRPSAAVEAYQVAQQHAKAEGCSCYLRLPRILHPAEEGLWQAALHEATIEGLYVSNWGGVSLARRLGLPFILGSAMNVMNDRFLLTVPDAEACYLSPELNRSEVLELMRVQGQRVAAKVHSRQLLMVHEQCLLGANQHCRATGRGCVDQGEFLIDRKGYRFPLLGDATCRSYLYNSQVFSLIDQVPELLRCGGKELMIDLELEEPDRITQILACYRPVWQEGVPPASRPGLSQLFPAGITRGHWRRGVL